MKRKLFFLMWLCLTTKLVNAQIDISEFSNLYMNAEVGKINGYENFVQGGISLQLDHHYFKIKSVIAYDAPTKEQKRLFKQYHDNCECSQEKRDLADIGLMYGRNYRILKHHQVQFGAGLSVFSKTDPDEAFNQKKEAYQLDQFKTRTTVGLPAEFRYAFQFKRYLAIGCTATVNVNPIKSYSAISAGISLGLF